MRQKDQLELNLSSEARGEAPSVVARAIEARAAKACLERPAVAGPSMEAIVEGENLKQALAQVKRNKGAAGIDGMSVDELAAYLKKHWPMIRAQLLEGTYKPQPVRRVEIPKASGGTRPLGIPTVLDRFIQQAVMQVLQADWDGTFSEMSFGFRPGRSAHQAVEQAQAYISTGHGFVVDIDLKKFFDRVNHDVLMGLIAKRVADKRILKLIRAFLSAGVMEGGLVSPTEEGTPQGGPLSPLLSNLMLDELDKETARRLRYLDTPHRLRLIRCRQVVEPGSWASAPSGRPADHRRSSRRSPPRPCCASLAPTLSSDSHARQLLPLTAPRPPGVRDRFSPRALRSLGRRHSGLHPSLRCPSSGRPDSSAAWLAREKPLYWPLPPFGPSAARRRLLCPRLTSAPRSGRLTATSVPLPRHSADLPR